MKNIKLTEHEQEVAKSLNLSKEFFEILKRRGLKYDEMQDFLYPSISDMMEPNEIKGMVDAKNRILKAISRNEKILIYGDYDCDGICAVAILMLFLRDKANVSYFIPDRHKHGYGLTIKAIQDATLNKSYDLFITVDCGVTACEEVEYLKSKGIDVIITDHHEPKEKLPDSIVVDPKIERKGFYDYCGAGVAFKLVESVAGLNTAKQYLDICAIATIADVVPLLKDNRIIAKFGLDIAINNPRKGLKILLGAEKLTSQDVMFKLAPRINAAGRLNSAMKVVNLFLEEDYFMLRSLADELNRDNKCRQEICERVVEECKQQLKNIDLENNRIIILYNENWEAGVLGIACSRLVDEFKCPALLFSKNGDTLKGSARSIPKINILNVVSKFADCFIAFGGHSQAIGATVHIDKFDELKQKLNADILDNFEAEDFIPYDKYDMIIEPNINIIKFAKELELLEPTGYSNPKPDFMFEGKDMFFDTIGMTPHIKCITKNLDIVGFYKYKHYMSVAFGEVDIIMSLGINVFQNKITAQGIIKTMCTKKVTIPTVYSDLMCLNHFYYDGESNIDSITNIEIEKLLEKTFGTVIVCFSQQEYENVKENIPQIKDLPLLIGNPKYLNTQNCVILCPASNYDFSYFKNVILAGRAYTDGYLKYIQDNSNIINTYGDCTPRVFKVKLSVMRKIFSQLRDLQTKNIRINNYKKLYTLVNEKYKIDSVTFAATSKMFTDLGLFSVSDKGIMDISNNKVDLNQSPIYRNIINNE